MKTSCKATMYLIDTSALDDMTASSSTANTDVSRLNYFNFGNSGDVVESIEHNCTVLDGSYNVASIWFAISYWSNNASNDDCTFTNNPSIKFAFNEPHTSTGMTMYFNSDYPSSAKVTWYYDAECTIKMVEKNYNIDSDAFFFKNQAEDFKAIVVEFTKTRLPGQFVKVNRIIVGQIISWEDDEVISATLNDEVDVTSATIPIGTCDMTIIDEENEFNIQNENGMWKSLKSGQFVAINEIVNDEEIALATYILDKWESKENAITFSMIDLIGVLDKTKCLGGMFNNAKVEDIVQSVMATSGGYVWSVDNSLKDIRLSGYIPICSHRTALQQIAFSLGAVASCDRSIMVTIKVPDRNADSYIPTSRKFDGSTSVQLDEYVSGVSITATQYKLNTTETKEIYNGFLKKGTNRIEFSEPFANISCTVGQITSSGANYCDITMADDGNTVISGNAYDTNDVTITKNVDRVAVGEIQKIKSFSGLTLCNTQLLPDISERLLDWYSLRQNVSIEYLCEGESVGDWVAIEDTLSDGKYAITRINSQSIDLTRGFIATAQCKGYSTETTSSYYMGNNELVMNGEGLI